MGEGEKRVERAEAEGGGEGRVSEQATRRKEGGRLWWEVVVRRQWDRKRGPNGVRQKCEEMWN